MGKESINKVEKHEYLENDHWTLLIDGLSEKGLALVDETVINLLKDHPSKYVLRREHDFITATSYSITCFDHMLMSDINHLVKYLFENSILQHHHLVVFFRYSANPNVPIIPVYKYFTYDNVNVYEKTDNYLKDGIAKFYKKLIAETKIERPLSSCFGCEKEENACFYNYIFACDRKEK